MFFIISFFECQNNVVLITILNSLPPRPSIAGTCTHLCTSIYTVCQCPFLPTCWRLFFYTSKIPLQGLNLCGMVGYITKKNNLYMYLIFRPPRLGCHILKAESLPQLPRLFAACHPLSPPSLSLFGC